jgi:hypothetical protein
MAITLSFRDAPKAGPGIQGGQPEVRYRGEVELRREAEPAGSV